MKISNWGKYPFIEAEEYYVENYVQAREKLHQNKKIIARGMGRSYGDSSLQNHILSMLAMNRFVHYDKENGILCCEAGTSLRDILELIIPDAWFLPVTPGTKHVSVGGAIAANVHGKNHHKEGSFCSYVLWIKLMTAKGEILHLSREENSDIFYATCGGMGLTGLILEAAFSLKKIENVFMRQSQLKARNLDQIFHFFEEYRDQTYSVAWIDCLAGKKNIGKSILMLGEHAFNHELNSKQTLMKHQYQFHEKFTIPFYLPAFVLNSYTVKLFNSLFASLKKDKRTFIGSFDPFFYPLDAIAEWNKIYSKKGFLQYQFVLPVKNSYDGMKEILEKISSSGMGSFLAVLKLFGKEEFPHSFPMEGYTLALDFPISSRIWKFLDRLDDIVMQYDGRFYAAKDARLGTKALGAVYPDYQKILEVKKKTDPHHVFVSRQAERLGFLC
jgi:decaprenylphospho-beta-D-ribofuranose 2-oxidase